MSNLDADTRSRIARLYRPQVNTLAEDLFEALRMCEAELVTLVARLPDPYRKNVVACLKVASAALEKIKEVPPVA